MASTEGLNLSAREMEVLALAWQCMEAEPKIDTAKLARLTGYTPNSATVTLSRIKRKLKDHAAQFDENNPALPKNASSAAGTPKKTSGTAAAGTSKDPKSTGKRATKVTATGDESPTKKRKATAKKGKGAASNGDDDDDEEFKVVNIKKEEHHDLLQGAQDFYNQSMPGYNNGLEGGENGV
ncbi:hypothetical protein EJ04DRAFT_434820 [Polyplosphaeria fusca]|uniref:Uncharacterized protein n=1 Tax=Polyplosphaeria fusca TaxID=682080 RepID=A0A9P4V3U9_9PLEO|nr:hypothetical protein EJ04DRAFT_434820 [Polyplosphaeria fusca]